MELTPDDNLLTGLTVNDGTRDLPMQKNIANTVGLGGPGIYVVHVPPDIESVTMTPTWTNSSITGVGATVYGITYGESRTGLSWAASASGTGKAVDLGRGNGSTVVALRVNGVSSAPYRLFLIHDASWQSADDRLKKLRLRAQQ